MATRDIDFAYSDLPAPQSPTPRGGPPEDEENDDSAKRFMDLSDTLDNGSGPKTDKILILCDALKALQHLRKEVAHMIEGNAALVDEIKELTAEKMDLRDEKARLKMKNDCFGMQAQDFNLSSTYLPHHAAAFYADRVHNMTHKCREGGDGAAGQGVVGGEVGFWNQELETGAAGRWRTEGGTASPDWRRESGSRSVPLRTPSLRGFEIGGGGGAGGGFTHAVSWRDGNGDFRGSLGREECIGEGWVASDHEEHLKQPLEEECKRGDWNEDVDVKFREEDDDTLWQQNGGNGEHKYDVGT